MILSQRGGVAELTGALIMIILTVAGFGLYYGAFQSRIANGSNVVIQQYQVHQLGVGEMLSLVYSSSAPGVATVYMYNYGTASVSIYRAALTDASGVSAAASWRICPQPPAACTVPLASIPSGTISLATFAYSRGVPVTLTVVTTNYAVFQFPLNQGGGS